MGIDEAYVNLINSHNNEEIALYSQAVECEGCGLQLLDRIAPLSNNISYNFRTWFGYNFAYTYDERKCRFQQYFKPKYRYDLILDKNCSLPLVTQTAPNAYIPLYVFMFIVTVLLSVYIISNQIAKFYRNREEVPRYNNRILSLDAIRGLNIAAMIFIHYDAGHYDLFNQSVWNGLQISDTIFPCFLWIIGVSMVISLSHKLSNFSRRELYIQVLRRSLIIYFIGTLLSTYNQAYKFYNVPLLGTLQRIAISFLIIGTIEVTFAQINSENNGNKYFYEITRAKMQCVLMFVIVSIYIAIIKLVHAPNCPIGYLGPGGLHMNGKYSNCTGGIASYIDRKILGAHIVKFGVKLYDAMGIDCNGPFSLLMTSFNISLGTIAGRVFVYYKTFSDRFLRLCSYGLSFILIGGIFCGFSENDGFIPINRILFSLPLVLISSGLAFCLLAFLFLIIDKRKIWNGKPFIFIGMNAIAIYVLQSLLIYTYPIHWPSDTHTCALLIVSWSLTFYILLAYYMYEKQIFIVI